MTNFVRFCCDAISINNSQFPDMNLVNTNYTQNIRNINNA